MLKYYILCKITLLSQLQGSRHGKFNAFLVIFLVFFYFIFLKEIISLNLDSKLGYTKPLTMRIRKLIHKLEDKKTFKDLKAKTILINDLGEELHK